MFKKYSKALLEKEVTPSLPDASDMDLVSSKHVYPYSSNPLGEQLPSSLSPQEFQKMEEEILSSHFDAIQERQEPETVIGEQVSMKGEISFKALLRIDGHFEGELCSDGKLIVGPTGVVKADIKLKEAYIAGKVTGDINVQEKLVLRGRAEIDGNITTPLLSVDEGVSINGYVKVSPMEKTVETIKNYQPDEQNVNA